MVKDGDGVKVYKPLNASILSTEIYDGTAVIWRSGPRDQEYYTLNPNSDNIEGVRVWGDTQVMCHTAYSDVLNSTSIMCYNPVSGQDIPQYIFK
jgi:hypothetical protein